MLYIKINPMFLTIIWCALISLCSVFLKDSVFIFIFSLFADQVYLLFGFYDRFYDLGMLKDGLFFLGLIYL